MQWKIVKSLHKQLEWKYRRKYHEKRTKITETTIFIVVVADVTGDSQHFSIQFPTQIWFRINLQHNIPIFIVRIMYKNILLPELHNKILIRIYTYIC